MKLLDINGKEVRIGIKAEDKQSRSDFQHRVKQALKERFPYEIILEDFTVPNSRLSVDFFLVRMGIVVEANGKQHREFSTFHHGNRLTDKKFGQQVKNDVLKENWAKMNGYKFITVNNDKEIDKIQSL